MSTTLTARQTGRLGRLRPFLRRRLLPSGLRAKESNAPVSNKDHVVQDIIRSPLARMAWHWRPRAYRQAHRRHWQRSVGRPEQVRLAGRSISSDLRKGGACCARPGAWPGVKLSHLRERARTKTHSSPPRPVGHPRLQGGTYHNRVSCAPTGTSTCHIPRLRLSNASPLGDIFA